MAANNSYEEAVALIASANRVVQDPNSVGAALRTISLRLRGTSVKELEESGEDTTGAVESKSKLRSKVKSLSGVDILTDTGAYKSTYEILLDISKVWEDMSDINQAALLEIIAGKTRSNTAAAILANTEDLEDAYESAMDAEGSALRENEKYLDSIQGRIDLFNNSIQTMWSNAINDKAIKTFVDIGTQLVKWVDNLGLIQTLVIGIGTYLTKKYFKGDLFGGLFGQKTQDIDQMKKTLEQLTAARDKAASSLIGHETNKYKQNKLTKAQSALDAYEQGPGAHIKEYDVLNEKLKVAQSNLDKYQNRLNNYSGTNKNTIKQYQSAVDKAQKEVDDLEIKLQEVEIQVKKTGNAGVFAGRSFKAGFKAAGKAVWQFSKEVLKSLATMYVITTAVELLIKAGSALTNMIDDMVETPEEAREKFEELNNELSSCQDELKSLESEFDAIQEQISELAAAEKLSFSDQEELERLRAESDELERQIQLNKTLEESLQKSTNEASVNAANQYLDNTSFSSKKTKTEREENAGDIGKTIGQTAGLIIGGIIGAGITVASGGTLAVVGAGAGAAIGGLAGDVIGSAVGGYSYNSEQSVGEAIDNMQEERAKLIKARDEAYNAYLASPSDKKAKEDYDEAVGALSQYDQAMAQHISQLQQYYNSMDYELATTEEKKAMKEMAATLDKYNIQMGSQNAKSSAIERIFGLDEYSNASKTIDNLVKQLERDPGNETILNRIKEQAKLAQTDLDAVGLSIDDVVSHYGDLGESLAFDTVEEKVQEIAKVTPKLEQLLAGGKNSDLFIGMFNEDGEVLSTAIAEYFKDSSSETREYIAKLVKDIEDGEIDIETALKKFELFGVESALKIQITDVQTNFKDVFVDLEDADGLLDTFEEFGEAIGSAANALDTFNQAQKEMANSGHVSIETALKLMEYTDDYGSILDVVDGELKLVDGAENVLIQSRLDAIKVSAETALADAQVAYEKAQLATKEYQAALTSDLSANVVAKAWEKLLAAGAGFVAGVKALWTSESWTEAYNRGYNESLSKITGYETEYSDDGLQELAKAEQKAKDALDSAQDRVNLANKLTSDTLRSTYSSSAADGTDSEADRALEKLQKKYERKISNLDNQQTYLENEIERLEAENKGVSKSYYEEQIKLEEQKMNLLQQERTELTALLNSTKEGTDDWWEIADALWEVEHSIQESTLRTIEFRESIAELYKTAFEDLDKAYGNKDDLYSDRQAYIEKYMELLELQGEVKPASAYLGLIAEEEAKLANSTAELIDLRRVLAEGMASGEIKAGDERWVEMQSSIRETEAAILDSKVAIEQYKEELKSLKVEAFELVRTAFSNRNDYYTNQQDYIEGYIDYLEASGIDATPEMYEKLIDIEKEKRANYAADLADAYVGFAKIEAAGYTAADEEWVDANNRIVELEKGIQDCDIAMAQWAQNIRELEFEKFDYFTDRVSNINKELNNVSKLVEDEDVAFDDGTWTKEGITKLSMLYHEMENNNAMIAKYKEELADLEEQYKSGAISEKDYTERADDLVDRQWELIHANEDIKDSIIDINEARIDLVEEGLNEEIDAYRELIELKKEELEAERDLYDFKRDVEKQTKDIAELERKIAGLSGSDDAADIAERRKLEAQLREAKDGLNDTYYNHAKDSQSQALDDELEAYEKRVTDYVESLRETLEKTDEMIEQTFADVLLNADVTYQTLVEIANTYGPALSANLMNPWQQMGNEAVRIKDQISGDLLLLNDDNIATFSINATPLLKQPFESGGLAAEAFKVLTVTQIDELQAKINASTSAATRDFNAMISAATTSTHTFSDTVESKLTNAVDKAQRDAIKMENYLTYPWEYGVTAVNTWSDAVETALTEAVEDWREAAAAISGYQSDIDNTPSYTTNIDNSGGTGVLQPPHGGSGGTFGTGSTTELQKYLNQYWNTQVYYATGSSQLAVDGKYGPDTKATVKAVQQKLGVTADGLYGASTVAAMAKFYDSEAERMKKYPSSVEFYKKAKAALPSAIYAKGTLGTKRDEWAITDESWIGEEITLAAGKNGQLQYLKKGSAVMPADISANLVEWGKINPDMTALANGVQGVNLMSNYVSKPEVNVVFDSLVHVDHCDEGTLKDLEKMVDTKINQFSKQMNYAIKRYK